mmetsp:Transcript_22266/g.44829  ORF Transcript_22266/g.44829 Transcript_22266/m.44829 type:complete len:635 (-) Transcript_22266:2247-4151(-)
MSRTITRTRTTTRTVQQTKTLDPDDSERRSLVLVSWNISSSQSSAIAPNPQLRAAEAPRLIREEILRSQPDIIVLQETLCPSYGSDHYSSSGYVSMGSQTAWVTQKHVSLDGTYIDLLVKRELASNAQRITFQTFETNELPAVAAIITLPNRTRIAVASLHLPHTKEAAPIRKRLCSAIMEQLSTQQCEGIILAGDFNMRKFEDNGTEQLCGGNWVDAWKAVTRSNYRKEYTWDGNENLYHGHDSFQFHCRFDRCYVKGEKLRLTHFDLIGNQPVDGKEGDYLSDHYGIVVKLDIGSTSTGSTSTDSIPSVNHAQNAAALRAARLQRFEMAPAVPNASAHQRNVNKRKIKKKPREDARDSLIDLSKDSDDENEEDTKRSSSSRGQHKFNNDNNMVDLTEDSDDEVEILEVAAASNNDGVSADTPYQNDTTIASTEKQSGTTTLYESSSSIFAPQNNDENDSHAGNSQSEDTVDINVDEEEVLKPTTNNDIHAGNIQDMDDTKVAEEEVSNMSAMNSSDSQSRTNQSDEDSIDIQVDHGINENAAMHSNPASPPLFYASSTASTPIRDNRASKPASKTEAQTKRKKRHHLSNSSSDDDDFAIMRAKLAKKKQSRDSSDSEDDFDEMRAKLKTKQH